MDPKTRETVIGIDVGSVTICIVSMDRQGKLLGSDYVLHSGDVRGTIKKLIGPHISADVSGIAATGGKTNFTGQVVRFDPQVSLMDAVSCLELGPRSILHVGAERFFLIELDEKGNYMQTSHSSSCAAGTGSFLDQQAARLRLDDASQISEMAMRNRSPIPDIAARCAVFAKTDLIHAQQKGYGLEAICDSLCEGLADNISDTLFNQSVPASPMYMTGGVSHNRSVVRHLERITGKEIIIHPQSHLFPAIGAASLLWKEIREGREKPLQRREQIRPGRILREKSSLEYYYHPLSNKQETSGRSACARESGITGEFVYQPVVPGHREPVRVDRYYSPPGKNPRVYLGIDVGSTSTKAMILEESGKPLSGYYTYTSGQPLKAVQALFEAIDHEGTVQGIRYRILACGTTGSGRKFIGTILRTDQVIDEITAHARAAFELDPETDTIIEIGGQDAKFTQMNNGMVTFSHMNTVCAAGTGSFIEELASRLGVALKDYERLAMDCAAPLASDRCTVFMERDINQLLSQGYSVREVLATVIHSVRENYLKKVASEAHIGDHICFQGATAKNKALVSAFEQRLKKPVFVSPFCHLTGAYGTALMLKEEHWELSRFRGLGIYQKTIPIETETCDLCLNRCTISVANIDGEKVAYGFLCGRDYDSRKFVRKKKSGFELLKERKKLMTGYTREPVKRKGCPVIGIPASLHLLEDLPFWGAFFRELGIPLVTSEGFRDSLKTGKKIAGAEFCAPIDAMYGHVAYLSGHCDHIFMPVYLESRVKPPHAEENFCYYTQYSASLAFLEGDHVREKLVSPMLNFHKDSDRNIRLLHGSLAEMGFGNLKKSEVTHAIRHAEVHARQLAGKLAELFTGSDPPGNGVEVVLMGRPYVVLSETLNKGIPDIFTEMGIRAWYQDMLPGGEDDGELSRLLEKIPWHFAANILRAAAWVSRKKNFYPVLITAFKCAPDSFIIEYFKQLMDLSGKPYLIIQIDEHDSNVGYETRIEAALRSFRNHARNSIPGPAHDLSLLLPRVNTRLDGKVLLMPGWDTFVSPLIVANLRRAGIDARLLETSELSIRKSMEYNTGQCLPINIIAQDYMDYLEHHDLDPARAILWMMEGRISCNLRQYPFFIKQILENSGNGMAKASVYSGEISHREMPVSVTYNAYFAYMLGGLFRKTACRIRPYEAVPGQTDHTFRKVQKILLGAMSGEGSVKDAIREGLQLVDRIEYDKSTRKPLVAIFGDLYVRDNDVMNQDLIRAIENAGGEVLVTPYHDYMKITIESIFRRSRARGEHFQTKVNRILLGALKFMDEQYYKAFTRYLGPAPVIRPAELEKHLSDFNVHSLHSGESFDNLLKIFYLTENYPGVALFIQASPSYCCPALVTEAMTRRIRQITGVPAVTITYDGTSDRMNEIIVPYIQGNKG
ncbi:MAG: acyl-CoA dehydratase activase [Bacteroidales bacterium]